MLSGFLACLSWVKREGNNISNNSVLKYFINRCIRILLLYYICILYYFFTETFIWKSIPIDPKGLYWLRYIFLLNGIVGEKSYFWSNLGITWTIPVFMFFYLIFPIINKIFNSLFKTVVLFIFTVFIAFFIDRYANGYISMLSSLPYFVVGMIIYRANAENKNKSLLIFVSLLLMCSEIISFNQSWKFCLYFIIIILAFLDFEEKEYHFVKAINTIDEYSYTCYLAHGIIFCGVLDKFTWDHYIFEKFIIAVMGTIILTIFIHNFMEQPIQKWLRQKVN